MTKKEKEILEVIKDNPTISHSELAKLFNISKNTVAVHISNLMNQGYLLGKAYLINEEDYLVGIGAANIDVYGKSEIKIRPHYDHPSKIHTSLGGVTRNILENLAYLKVNTKLLSAVGDDMYGKAILEGSKKNNIDVSNVLEVKDNGSGIFVQVLDDDNDMHLAICDMSIIKYIDINYLKEKENVLKGSKMIIFDPSLNIETIEYLIDNYKDKALFLDPVSEEYAKKIKPYIPYLHTFKPNISELEAITNKKINNDDELIKACKRLIDSGLKNIYVSLGKNGCLFMNNKETIKRKFKEVKNVVNYSGAGDSFFAGIIYSYMNDFGINDTINYGLASGILALSSNTTSNNKLSIREINKIIKENKK